MARRAYFRDDTDTIFEPQFGVYVLMYYYAYQVDPVKAMELFAVIVPKYSYYLEKDDPIRSTFAPEAKYTVEYDADRFNLVLDFINDDINTALYALDSDVDIVEHLGGSDFVEDDINTNHFFGVKDEFYGDDRSDLGMAYHWLKQFIQRAIDTGTSYEIH